MHNFINFGIITFLLRKPGTYSIFPISVDIAFFALFYLDPNIKLHLCSNFSLAACFTTSACMSRCVIQSALLSR